MKRVTIPQLADEAGVSVATINRILGGQSNVREKTARHVLEVAQRIGFYGSGAIRSNIDRSGPPRTIGLLVQDESAPFHVEFARRFVAECDSPGFPVLRPKIAHLSDLDPARAAAKVTDLAADCNAIAICTADHPLVNEAVDLAVERGTPVIAAVSRLSSTRCSLYVGMDNRRLGRSAGWFACNLRREGIGAAVLSGTSRHVCQEQREMGFRSFIREQAEPMPCHDAPMTMETDSGGYEAMRSLLARHPDLAVVFVTGGGVRGCLAALKEAALSRRPMLIGCELTPETQMALIEGLATVILAHPFGVLTRSLVAAFREVLGAESKAVRPDVLVPFRTATPESHYSDLVFDAL